MSNQTARKPSHRIYIVTGEGDKTYWQDIGAAWPHRDGEGYNLTSNLGSLKIVMRAAKEHPAKRATK